SAGIPVSEFRATESRVSEIRVSTWTHDNPKSAAAAAGVRGVPEAGGAASAPLKVPDSTAAQHTQNFITSIKLLSSVSWTVRVPKLRLLTALPPQTSCPFPHIPRHILTAIRTRALRKTTHCTRAANIRFHSIGVLLMPFV